MTAMGRLLVIGRNGQLARALASLAPDAVTLDRQSLDLSSPPDDLAARFESYLDDSVNGVILAAAYTQVDKAEEDRDTAMAVNGVAPGIIAQVCEARNLPLVHISTDYVFNGTGTLPYTPDLATDPINAYGETKRAGERAVAGAGGTYAILRTSWVYDGTGGNFLTTMLRLAQTRDELSVVDDQIGRPTFAIDLAKAALAALQGLQDDPAKSGLYHVSNKGEPISWAAFAKAIFEAAEVEMIVHPIPSTDYPTPAKRPAYSVMDVDSFEATFGYHLPDWQDGLRRALAQRVTDNGS